MTCSDIESLIGPYVDNDLAREARHRVDTHLMGCKNCAWEAQSLLVTRERLREGVGEVVASDSLRARVLSRLRADNPHVSCGESEQDAESQFLLPMNLPERSPRL